MRATISTIDKWKDGSIIKITRFVSGDGPMDRYMLTSEGRARYRRMKLSVDTAERPDGYKILDYIYEHGADTVDEIGVSTGLSREQVVAHLQVYLNHGLVEELE